MKDWFELVCNQCQNYLEVSICQRDGDELKVENIHVYCANCVGGCKLQVFYRWKKLDVKFPSLTEPDPQTADKTDGEE